MGRTRSFASTSVVQAAREVFWRQGYAETSVPDLEEATGLKRSSLYNAYGSKRGLFDAAVQDYLDQLVRPHLAPLRKTTVEPGALHRYLTGFAASLRRGSQGAAGTAACFGVDGCLLLNAAASSLSRDEEMAGVLRAYYAELGEAVGAGVRAALPALSEADALALAREVTGSTLGALSLARIDRENAAVLLDLAAQRVKPKNHPPSAFSSPIR